MIAAVFGRNLLMNQGSPFVGALSFYNTVGSILT